VSVSIVLDLEKENVVNVLYLSLVGMGARIASDPTNDDACVAQFVFASATTTLRLVLNDSSGAPLTITNMTTLPHEMKHRGYGTLALEQVLRWAAIHDLVTVRAVQVQSERFWIKNRFEKLAEPNPCNDFAFQDHFS